MRLIAALAVLLAASSSLAGDRRHHRPVEEVELFEHVGFDGRARAIDDDAACIGGRRWNDTVSSLRIPPGKTVVLYEHADFTGRTLTLTGDVADLRAFRGPGRDRTWNDVVSAVRVFDRFGRR